MNLLRAYIQHLQTPTCILLNLSKMDIRVSYFQDYTIKEMMNLIVVKNEFDPNDAMVDQLAIDSLQIS